MTAAQIIEQSARHIAGGVVSLNRQATPALVFVRAQGSHLWDAAGREYLGYHARQFFAAEKKA